MADDMFKWIFLNENGRVPIQISMKFVLRSPIDNKPAMVQIMARRRPVHRCIYAALGRNELSWGRWPPEKYFLTPGHAANPVLSYLSDHSNPIVLEAFHVTQACHECKICSGFHRIWKIIVEMAFSAHFILIWKLNRICSTSIIKVVPKCIWKPHVLAWGLSSTYTKIFRVEQAKLKVNEKVTVSLDIPRIATVRFASIRSWQW